MAENILLHDAAMPALQLLRFGDAAGVGNVADFLAQVLRAWRHACRFVFDHRPRRRCLSCGVTLAGQVF